MEATESLVSTVKKCLVLVETGIKGVSPRAHTNLVQGYAHDSMGMIKAITCSFYAPLETTSKYTQL